MVTLMTDFGTVDGYVAAVKGVMASISPTTSIFDAGHDIPRGDIQAGAWALRQYWRFFPAGTIHVAVVDPGVGSSRKALLACADRHILLAPDNGLLGWVYEAAETLEVRQVRAQIHRPGGLSATFHGRDVFGYVAGLLASGEARVEDVSDSVETFDRPAWLCAQREGARIVGEIVHIDHFGNVITNITREQLSEAGWSDVRILAGSSMLYRIYNTYSDVREGQPVALIGSSGTLEMAVNGGSAEQMLGLKRRVKVAVEKV
jgi:S-adenosylmethionine hydrolase